MIDQKFCLFLEYELTKAFSNSDDQEANGFFCDGILLPFSENEISRKYVNDKREILMSAFIGFNGQDRYKLRLKFGSKSLSRYARGLDIKECVPPVTESDWYDIDLATKTLVVRLL